MDIAHSIQQSDDGGYIVAGETDSFGARGYDVWVLKLNFDGSVNWEKTYSTSRDDVAYSIHQTANGSYLVTTTLHTPSRRLMIMAISWLGKLILLEPSVRIFGS